MAIDFRISNLNKFTVFLDHASVTVTGGAAWGTQPPDPIPGRGSRGTSNTVQFDANAAPANSGLTFDYRAQIVEDGGARIVDVTLSFVVSVNARSYPTIDARCDPPDYFRIGTTLSGTPGNYQYAITLRDGPNVA